MATRTPLYFDPSTGHAKPAAAADTLGGIVAAVLPVAVPYDTSALAVGDLVYVSALNTLTKTDNTISRLTADALGAVAVVGTVPNGGCVITRGPATVKFLGGLAPAVGDPAWVAQGGGGNIGKAQLATPAGGPGAYKKCLGRITDITAYAGSVTCVVCLNLDNTTVPNVVVNNSSVAARLVNYGVIVAANVTGVHALYIDSGVNLFPGPITNPAIPRNVTVDFEAAWAGGDVTIDGTDQFGVVNQEILTVNLGAQRVGVEIFATITAITKAAVGGGGANHNASVGWGNKIGIVIAPADFVGGGPCIDFVNGVAEAGTLDTANAGFLPTTVPAGAAYVLMVMAVHAHTVS